MTWADFTIIDHIATTNAFNGAIPGAANPHTIRVQPLNIPPARDLRWPSATILVETCCVGTHNPYH